jgi:ABC-type lipoprotein export system ATPase subunit
MLADELTANLDARRGQGLRTAASEDVGDEQTVVMVPNERRIPEVADRALWAEGGRQRPES